MATICLRQEGGSHNFQDRQIKVENRFVTVGRTTEARKPDLANATFSSLGISEEQAVFWFDKDGGRFYLQNKDYSNGCLLNEEIVGLYAVELVNGDRLEFGHMSGIESVRAIVMLDFDVGHEETQGLEDDTERVENGEDNTIQSQSLLFLHKEAEWKFMMQKEDKLWKAQKAKEIQLAKEKERAEEAVLDMK